MILRGLCTNKFIGATCAACLLATLSGISTSWSSPVIPKLQNISNDNPFDYIVTSSQVSWMTSLVTLGACVGCIVFGFFTHTIGRRFSMCTVTLPMALGYIMMVLFPKIEVFYVARFLTGLSVGGGHITTMSYNSEITNKKNRGAFMTFTSMMVSVGSLIGYCVGPWVKVTIFNLILLTFPVAAMFLTVLFCVETPYFYLLTNKEKLAKESLLAYSGSDINVDEEIVKIRENIKEQQVGSLLETMKTKAFLKSFTIATMLLIFQQFTGVAGILMYSQSIFEILDANLSSADSAIILGAVFVVGGGVAPLIAGRFNRRTILITSSLGLTLSQSILGIYCILNDAGTIVYSLNFIPITTLCMFIFSYNYGIGPLCWVVAAEVYSTRVKCLAMGFSIIIYHLIEFGIVQFYSTIAEIIGIGQLFIVFAGFCLLFILFISFYVIETKGKSLEEIQNILKGN